MSRTIGEMNTKTGNIVVSRFIGAAREGDDRRRVQITVTNYSLNATWVAIGLTIDETGQLQELLSKALGEK